MIRTLNFTGRKRIPREAARITLRAEAGSAIAFDVELTLDGMELPPAAQVFVEAAFKTAFMRFDCGTVAKFEPPLERLLNRLPQPQLAHFRVKVVEPSNIGPGRLLAVADGITPEGFKVGDRRRVFLFRVSYVSDLIDELWRLDFDDAGPILELQQMIGMKEIARQEAFMALVYPELVRQILRQVLFVEKIDDPYADSDSWQARWLRFGAIQAGARLPALDAGVAGQEHEEWITAAASGFSRRLRLVAKFKKRFAGVEADVL
jgi:hypothetical protein